ncbi:enoyl-CoA hydratase-related protein [Streptomyces sp. NPDC055092]
MRPRHICDLDVVSAIAGLGVPVVAAVSGPAVIGGLEIALGCDFRLAGESARFAETHARVGIVPGWGLTGRLSLAVGRGGPVRCPPRAITSTPAWRNALAWSTPSCPTPNCSAMQSRWPVASPRSTAWSWRVWAPCATPGPRQARGRPSVASWTSGGCRHWARTTADGREASTRLSAAGEQRELTST